MAERDLLVELGVEEIPAKFLARALAELPALATTRLEAARLTFASVRALGTPRRIALEVRGLASRQPDLRERVVGPPAGAAFGADGAPTKAAIGFAQKNGVEPASLEQAEVEGKKGKYVIAVRQVTGRDATEVLPPLLQELIAAIPWPKSMRWGWGEAAFVRPVHWLVCLLDADVLPVQWGGLSAGRTSRGHRFLSPSAIELASSAGYVETLRRAFVIVDPEARRDTVAAELRRVEGEVGLSIRPDAALLAEVTNLVEYPVAVSGTFDPAFLEVPEEVIVTAMRTHQRYFALEQPGVLEGTPAKLAPRFVTIAGTITRDAAVVAQGNQRVLAARLSDAQFFFREDRKKSLDEFARTLDAVTFQAKLGTVGQKIKRIVASAEAITALMPELGAVPAELARAAALAKADLATNMVGEFPELQGVMGSHYARLAGEPEGVWRAIADHYRPRGASDTLPETLHGAIVGLADRLDTIVGCFAVSLEPTGSTDPFGLRRAALAILGVALDRGWHIDLDRLIAIAKDQLVAQGLDVTPTDVGEVREFFRGRLRGLLIDDGLAAQDVDAALGAGFEDPGDARIRARDLGVVPREAREVFKRIANILDDAHGKAIAISGHVDPAKFAAAGNVEHKLWDLFGSARDRADQAIAAREYRRLFGVLVELQPTVAAFFDRGGVMVMDPDPAIRDNRLSLLQTILAPFARVADFRALAVQS